MKSNAPKIALGIVGLLVIVGVVLIYFFINGTAFYKDSQQGFSFKYPRSWKTVKQEETAKQLGKVTIVMNPETQKNNPNNNYFGDVFVISVPYVTEQTSSTKSATALTGVIPPHAQQIKDLITAGKLATDNKTQPISIGNLTGYTAVTTASEGAVLNVVLQGAKNMLLIKFPNVGSEDSLNKEQLTILNSLQEQ